MTRMLRGVLQNWLTIRKANVFLYGDKPWFMLTMYLSSQEKDQDHRQIIETIQLIVKLETFWLNLKEDSSIIGKMKTKQKH